jgi:hypothetical protein
MLHVVFTSLLLPSGLFSGFSNRFCSIAVRRPSGAGSPANGAVQAHIVEQILHEHKTEAFPQSFGRAFAALLHISLVISPWMPPLGAHLAPSAQTDQNLLRFLHS